MASATAQTGIDVNPAASTELSQDPFAGQREPGNDPFNGDLSHVAGDEAMRQSSTGSAGSPPKDRRMSKEWDASKVPPSQFQKRKGSLFATPAGRDGHTQGKDRDKAYFEKLREKGWLPSKK